MTWSFDAQAISTNPERRSPDRPDPIYFPTVINLPNGSSALRGAAFTPLHLAKTATQEMNLSVILLRTLKRPEGHAPVAFVFIRG